MNADTRADMRRAGPVVWLRASAEILEERIKGDASTAVRRPDLTDAGGRHEIEDLLALREPLYRECASLTIDTGEKSPADVADAIAQALDPVILGGGAA